MNSKAVRKTVYVKAYYAKNLGDDLFLKILAERYDNVRFITYLNPRLRYWKLIKNLVFNRSLTAYYKNRSVDKKRFLVHHRPIAMLSIGGSIFIEQKDESKNHANLSEYQNLGLPYFIIGCNFGPFISSDFLAKVNDVFANSADVCARDTYTYNIFNKKLQNNLVRYAPDIIFGLDPRPYQKQPNDGDKRVLISVIDCTWRFDDGISKNYEKNLKTFITDCLKQGKVVTLMSFCKMQGDEAALNRIFKSIKHRKNNLHKYYYRGKIDEALKIIGQNDVIVGSRFHATVLGLCMRKKVIPLSYSGKTDHMLCDIGYGGKIYKIKDLSPIVLSGAGTLDEKTLQKLSADSKKHFANFDDFVNNQKEKL